MNGTNTTLKIVPHGGDEITLYGLMPASISSYALLVDMGSVNLGLQDRLAIDYQQAPPGYGGEPVSLHGPLVPVSFRVIIKATSQAYMLAAYRVLQRAALNPRGGWLVYKPENLSGGVPETLYRYVRSAPPAPVESRENRFDSAARSDGFYTMYIDVVLQTQPIAVSDPTSDVMQVFPMGTPCEVALGEFVPVAPGDLIGGWAALSRIRVAPHSGGAGTISRLILAHKTVPNCMFVEYATGYYMLDASLAEYFEGCGWGIMADADRYNGTYIETIACGGSGGFRVMRFPIASPELHTGRFAALAIIRTFSGLASDWVFQSRLLLGDVEQGSGFNYSARVGDSWHYIFLGEFDVPPTSMSSLETDYASSIILEVSGQTESATAVFGLDAIVLLPVQNDVTGEVCAVDVNCEDSVGDGFGGGGQALLLDNFPGLDGRDNETAHIIAGTEFYRTLVNAPSGTFPTLDPEYAHILIALIERGPTTHVPDLSVLEDTPDGYMVVADFEDTNGTWAPTAQSAATQRVEGQKAIVLEASEPLYGSSLATGQYSILAINPSRDISGGPLPYDGSLFACVYVEKLSGATATQFEVEIILSSSASPFDYADTDFHARFSDTVTEAQLAMFGNSQDRLFTFDSKGAFFDWGNITAVFVGIGLSSTFASAQYRVTLDYARLQPYSTGVNFTGDPPLFSFSSVTKWAVVKSGDLHCLALLPRATDFPGAAAYYVDPSEKDVTVICRLNSLFGVGRHGIFCRGELYTSELTYPLTTGYMALLDYYTNTIKLVRYDNPAGPTTLASASFTAAEGEWIVMALVVNAGTISVYAAPSLMLVNDREVLDSEWFRLSASDTTHASGDCGVASQSDGGCLFDGFTMLLDEDKVVAGDVIDFALDVLPRTLAPFHETL